MNPHHQAFRPHHFETGFEQKFFHERIAHLHRRPVGLRFLGEFPARKRRAREAILAGGAADVNDRIADAFSFAAFNLVVTNNAEAKRVDERIAIVRIIKINFAADGRNADAISVMRDAGHDAGKEPAIRYRLRRVTFDWSEPERVEPENRPRTHRENIANDAAHTGRRALKRLDRARMVVRLDLERNRPAVADIHDAGVFLTGFDENEIAVARKLF